MPISDFLGSDSPKSSQEFLSERPTRTRIVLSLTHQSPSALAAVE